MIPRRKFLKTASVSAVAMALPAIGWPREYPGPKKKNVVLLLTDDMGMHLECLGTRGLQTPHLNALAKRGVLFKTANAPCATCSPARTTLLSGQFPNEHLVWHNVFPLEPHHVEGKPMNWAQNILRQKKEGVLHSFNQMGDWWPAPQAGRKPDTLDNQPTLNTILLEQGYYLGLTQKHHIGYPHRFPFDYFRKWRPGLDRTGGENPSYYKGMEEFIQLAGEKPYFLMANLTWTHRPLWHFNGITRLPEPDPAEVEVPPLFPDTPEVRADIAAYYKTIQACDEHIGEIIAAVEAAGQLEETIFVFTPDQGPGFHRYKNTCYEGGISVPLIIAGPGIKARPGISEAMFSHADLAPTLLDMMGLPVPDSMSGFSAKAFFSGETQRTKRQYEFGVYHQPLPDYSSEYPSRSISDGRWKFILNHAPERNYEQAADMRTPGAPWFNKTYGETIRLGEAAPRPFEVLQKLTRRSREEFYDLKADPYEMENLLETPSVMSEAQKQVHEKLKAELKKWMDARGDNGLMIQ